MPRRVSLLLALLTACVADEALTPAAGLLAATALLDPGAIASGAPDPDDDYGHALAVGDFDGDGNQDLAVGVPGGNFDTTSGGPLWDAGRVEVIYGSATGLAGGEVRRFEADDIDLGESEAGDAFGHALATGDLDDDGFDDLAVGIPYETIGSRSQTGAIAVLYGSPSGLSTARAHMVSQKDAGGSNGRQDYFGSALAIGRFDRDRFADLAVGAPGKDSDGWVDSGGVTVLYGGVSGLDHSGDSGLPIVWSEHITQAALPSGTSSETGDGFGGALAAGDLDDDDDDELIAGSPAEDIGGVFNAGMVIVMLGSSGGLLPAVATAYDQSEVPGGVVEESDGFGAALAVGDFDGDGVDDLAAGAPYEESDDGVDQAGAVAVLRGKRNGLRTAFNESITETSARGVKNTADRAGYALAAADFDGDGYDDLAAGAPGNYHYGVNAGGVLVFFGSAAALHPARAYVLPETAMDGIDEAADKFGHALAAGDFDGDGKISLAVGAPNESVPDHDGVTLIDAGAVYAHRVDVLPEVPCNAAIVVDRATGEVLGKQNPDQLRAPASTTKMMTALLASEAIADGEVGRYDTVVIQDDIDSEGGGRIGLVPGDRISLDDLIHLALVSSENDAAVAIGTYVGGTQDAFIERMNERAAELGLDDTHYVDIAGSDPEDLWREGRRDVECHGNDFDNEGCAHYSTARDLAALGGVLLDDPLLAGIVATESWTTTTWTRSGFPVNEMVGTSNLLLADGDLHYDGVYGVKTGTTNMAGANLVSAAVDGDRDVIAVVLGCDLDTDDRFTSSALLLDYGMAMNP